MVHPNKRFEFEYKYCKKDDVITTRMGQTDFVVERAVIRTPEAKIP